MDSILTIEPDLVTTAVRTLVLATLSAYRSGVRVEWHGAELGVYLVYIFGEISKSVYYNYLPLGYSHSPRWW